MCTCIRGRELAHCRSCRTVGSRCKMRVHGTKKSQRQTYDDAEKQHEIKRGK